MEEGRLEFKNVEVNVARYEEGKPAIRIGLPFYGMMTPVGLVRSPDTTVGGPCGANAFCLIDINPSLAAFNCEACGHAFHVECVSAVSPASTCGCRNIGTHLTR